MSEPAGAGAVVMLSAAAGEPCPTGTRTDPSSTSPTATTTAVTPAPNARLAFAELRIGAANRNGFSTNRRVSTAKTPEISAAANRAASPSG